MVEELGSLPLDRLKACSEAACIEGVFGAASRDDWFVPGSSSAGVGVRVGSVELGMMLSSRSESVDCNFLGRRGARRGARLVVWRICGGDGGRPCSSSLARWLRVFRSVGAWALVFMFAVLTFRAGVATVECVHRFADMCEVARRVSVIVVVGVVRCVSCNAEQMLTILHRAELFWCH